MDKKKLILGLGGIGGLAYLSYRFSKDAEPEDEKGDPRPATDEERRAWEIQQATNAERNDFTRSWTISPEMFAYITNWDTSWTPLDQNSKVHWAIRGRPSREEANFRRTDLRERRAINWTYVSDFYTDFPEYSQGANGLTKDDYPNTEGWQKGSVQYVAHRDKWWATVQQGGAKKRLCPPLPVSRTSRSTRRASGETRWTPARRNLDKNSEQMVRDFYSVYTYGWDQDNSQNGIAFLLGVGGFMGFVALWKDATRDSLATMIPNHWW